MEAIFWGTRGSVPMPLTASQVRAKVRDAIGLAIANGLSKNDDIDEFVATSLPFELSSTFGGNTACVEIRDQDQNLIFDMGSGIRSLGRQIVDNGPTKTDIFLSHLHWDHIQGLPFFAPVYVPGHEVRIWSAHEHAEKALKRQHSAPYFPVDFSQLAANISFHQFTPGLPLNINGFQIDTRKQIHHGDSFGFRVSKQGRSIVYATDIEHKSDRRDEIDACVKFFRNADLVIFDAMFAWGETQSIRQDWGHSSNVVGVDLCLMAKARHLCLFHHDPANTDAELSDSLEQTIRYVNLSNDPHSLQISSASDGLVIKV